MNTSEKIVERLEQLLEEVEYNVEVYGEEQHVFYARGVRDALSKAQSIADGF